MTPEATQREHLVRHSTRVLKILHSFRPPPVAEEHVSGQRLTIQSGFCVGRVVISTGTAFAAGVATRVWLLCLDIGPIEHVPRARMPDKLPIVLSREEIGQLMQHVDGMMGLIVFLLYGTGVRLQECVELRVKDLEFDRHQIVVRGVAHDRRIG